MKVWLLLLGLAFVASAASTDPHKPVRGVFQVGMSCRHQHVASQPHPGTSKQQREDTYSQQDLPCAASHAHNSALPTLQQALTQILMGTFLACCRCVQTVRLEGGLRCVVAVVVAFQAGVWAQQFAQQLHPANSDQWAPPCKQRPMARPTAAQCSPNHQLSAVQHKGRCTSHLRLLANVTSHPKLLLLAVCLSPSLQLRRFIKDAVQGGEYGQQLSLE
jgi:hypothetical protein